MNLTNLADIRALLARHDFRFSKSLGQNFLTAAWVPADIADASGADARTGVLEVGPGIGCLTEQLAQRAGKVVSVELDKRLRPVLAQLAQLRHTCEAFRTGQLRVLRAEDGILHYQRVGKVETAEIIVNRTEHIIVETLASGKSTEVNPMGFTIVVEEVGHNPNHSYYDYV